MRRSMRVILGVSRAQVFIVYFGEHEGDKALHEIEDSHHSYLLSVKESEEDARASLLYSYKHSINGFAAVLTEDEASKLSGMSKTLSSLQTQSWIYPSILLTGSAKPCWLRWSWQSIHTAELKLVSLPIQMTELDEVVSVIRSDPSKYSLQTTRSWEFLGLENQMGDGAWDWKDNQLGEGLWLRAKYGREVIFGVLDSGKNPFELNYLF